MASPATKGPASLEPPGPAASHRTPRRHWRWAVIGLLALGLSAHAPILRGLARALIADDPAQSAAWVLVLHGDYRFDRAAELYHRGTASRILVINRPATRLVRLGVVPSKKEQCLRELRRRGVSPNAVTALPGDDQTPWHVAHALQAWLAEQPRTRVLVLCDRFKSGNLRFIVSRVMQTGESERVAFRGLPDQRYDETNWWRSRAGVRAFTGAAFELAYDCLHGEDAGPAGEVDLDRFERELLGRDHLELERP